MVTKDGKKIIYANSTKSIATSVPLIRLDESDLQNSPTIYRKPDIQIGMDYFFQFVTSFDKSADDIYNVNTIVRKMICKTVPPYPSNTVATMALQQNQRTTNEIQKEFAMPKYDTTETVVITTLIQKMKLRKMQSWISKTKKVPQKLWIIS